MKHKRILALLGVIAVVNMASTTVGAFESEVVDVRAHVTPSAESIQWMYDLLNGLGETSIVNTVEGP